jgi:hypothetical protein
MVIGEGGGKSILSVVGITQSAGGLKGTKTGEGQSGLSPEAKIHSSILAGLSALWTPGFKTVTNLLVLRLWALNRKL